MSKKVLKKLKAIYLAISNIYNYFVFPYIAPFGLKDESVNIAPPCLLIGTKNIYLHDNVQIGPSSIFFAPHSKIIIKKNTYSGPRLFISTGNHYSKVGHFSLFLSHEDKIKDNVLLNWDVTIDEDVWIGANVTILCKHIGRGSIIAVNDRYSVRFS